MCLASGLLLEVSVGAYGSPDPSFSVSVSVCPFFMHSLPSQINLKIMQIVLPLKGTIKGTGMHYHPVMRSDMFMSMCDTPRFFLKKK